MNYELAKKLKEAGFNVRYCDYATNNNCQYCCQPTFESGTSAGVIPTLSELIESCGEPFYELTKFGDIWQARTSYGFEKEPEIRGGSTPEEAVANLWLELNKK